MDRMKLTTALIVLTTCVAQNFGAPADSMGSLVVSASGISRTKRSDKEGVVPEVASTVPQIYQMHVQSDISNRFARTTITSKVKNLAEKSQEATFSVVLPETAFISGFVMEVDGKNYTAYVKEKEEAKKTYDQAVASGQGAAHVAVSARDSNRFTVSVNVEPETKAAFYLSYEELLKRDNSHYELVMNLHPGQPVKDLSVEVVIKESRKIIDLKAPPLRSGNEIGSNNPDLDPRADLEIINDTSAVVRFTPNLERQKQLAHLLGTNGENGLAGQFVVQYDVERDPKGGEVLIQDGYFVHFFAPSELTPLPKHVVFVLDTSSSMSGTRIGQLKEAMHKILEQLHDNDLFSLVEFNSNVKVWDLNNADSSVWFPNNNNNYGWNDELTGTDFSNYKFPNAYLVNADNIKKAKDTVSKFIASGGTDINTALKVGLHLVEREKEQNSDTTNHQPLIIFLTDGEPTVRIRSTEQILNTISEYNSAARKAPIFALSFGSGADKNFLQKLALRNSGFSKHIYEASDASLQLQDFYRQISSPLLANVTFKYEPSVTSLTKTDFPIYFGGSEIAVCGWSPNPEIMSNVYPEVAGWNGHRLISLRPTIQQSAVSNIERLWGYLTVKQLLEEKETSDTNKEELKQKALDLALKYSFVTPVSSLVVVKPNATDAVDTEVAEKRPTQVSYRSYSGMSRQSGVPYSSSSSSRDSDRILHSSYDSSNIGSRNIASVHGFSRYDRFGAVPLSNSRHYQNVNHAVPENRIHPSPPAATRTPDLLNELPWLSSILNENGTLTLPTGTYKLGLNETITDTVACPKTPLNGAGYCTLLHSCPQVHSLLTTVAVFVNHFCDLKNEYAGICCPSHP